MLIRTVVKNKWQAMWNREGKGRNLYKIQENGGGRDVLRLRRGEESVITKLRLGHTRLNSTLKLVGKHTTGRCKHRQENMASHSTSVPATWEGKGSI